MIRLDHKTYRINTCRTGSAKWHSLFVIQLLWFVIRISLKLSAAFIIVTKSPVICFSYYKSSRNWFRSRLRNQMAEMQKKMLSWIKVLIKWLAELCAIARAAVASFICAKNLYNFDSRSGRNALIGITNSVPLTSGRYAMHVCTLECNWHLSSEL